MILKGVNDGDYEDIDKLKKDKFSFNLDRDFAKVLKDADTDEYNYKYRFVGFITNSNNDIISVFPLKYQIDNEEIDSKDIFRAIFKHIQQRPDMYVGEKKGENFKTNFPFFAFYAVYEHYQKYGIHFEEKLYLKEYGSGKINWKETIRLSEKYIVDSKLVMLPIFHNQSMRVNTFIANCMIFIIDYTLEKFHHFIDAEKTNLPFPEFDFLANTDFVLQTLHSIRAKTYNDVNISLIENTIAFFEEVNQGGNYYLKHYSFYAIWEEMLKEYLNYFYSGYKDGQIVLATTPLPVKNNFSNPKFYPNSTNNKQFFQPDFYFTHDNIQLIFDAKYYDVNSMDYKQISYLFFLKNKRDNLAQTHPTYTDSHAALLIPYHTRSSRKHFSMNPVYNKEFSDFHISEERIDIREVISFWINL